MTFTSVLEKLTQRLPLTGEDFVFLLTGLTPQEEEQLFPAARETARRQFGNRIFIRGLIEISNLCKNDCYYCGIRKSNQKVARYRLTKEQILSCCEIGYPLGFRTFVLQGGEDGAFTDDWLCGLLQEMKRRFPDCAITLSLGERSRESYRRLKQAGADRYLLREETADFAHYYRLHPAQMSPQHRQDCLFALKELGYQTGGGFMVGSPGQTVEHLAQDFLFLQKLQPHMVGIGPLSAPSGHPLPGLPSGGGSPDGAVRGHSAAAAAGGQPARHHGPGYSGPKRAAAGGAGGGQCNYAQPFSGGSTGQLQSVRPQSPFRGGSGGGVAAAATADGGNRLYPLH